MPWTVIRINWALESSELLRIFRYEFWQDGLSPEDRKRLDPKLGNGKGLLCPLIADPADTAEGFALAIDHFEKAKNNIFNIAATGPFRYQDFIERVAAGLGLEYDSAKLSGCEPYSISNEKAQKLLGYKPRHTMAMMIEVCVGSVAKFPTIISIKFYTELHPLPHLSSSRIVQRGARLKK